ncbi:hypothetical protein TNCV_5059841 [Trichonephila clavipes]|nr:hypothetical protein TNCV_5059841 [Trichonephila clavipes]
MPYSDAGIVVSDADCCAVRPGFESRRRHVCKCIVPTRHGSTLNSCRAANPLVRLIEGEERWKTPDHPRVLSLKTRLEMGQIVLSPVWCLKLRPTTNVT